MAPLPLPQLLFLYFGVKLLMEARNMEGSGPSDELQEVEEELIHKKEGECRSLEGDEGLVEGRTSLGCRCSLPSVWFGETGWSLAACKVAFVAAVFSC